MFQAYDGEAAEELCRELPDIRLLMLNTEGTGMDSGSLVHVPTLDESFNATRLLDTVAALLHRGNGAASSYSGAGQP